jgi:uncharacterized iron-regulated membrane protein
MAGFLVVVGLTGSVLAFREAIDVWLNPALLTVAPRDAPTLDPLVLREKAAALHPSARVDGVSLRLQPGRSFEIGVQWRDEAGAQQGRLLYLDPYTGETLGERRAGEVSLARENIVGFLYRLHCSLALPARTGRLGPLILGVTALLWTIDCLVAFSLTLPPRRRGGGKSWAARWAPAWMIKFGAGAYRINFDIHRAFGLWTIAMLFVFAWSGVSFNLREVYAPTMQALFGKPEPRFEAPLLSAPLDHPRLDWREARNAGAALLRRFAEDEGFRLLDLDAMSFDGARGVYVMEARSSVDRGEWAELAVVFDADDGALRHVEWIGAPDKGLNDTLTFWLAALHMAKVFGLPMQIFVCAMGVVVATLSGTGVTIWWKKRKARRHVTRGAASAAAPAK